MLQVARIVSGECVHQTHTKPAGSLPMAKWNNRGTDLDVDSILSVGLGLLYMACNRDLYRIGSEKIGQII